MLRVGADGIDGAVMPLDLPNRCEVIHVPDLHQASAAGTQQHGAARDESQGTNPVLVCIRDLLLGFHRDKERMDLLSEPTAHSLPCPSVI